MTAMASLGKLVARLDYPLYVCLSEPLEPQAQRARCETYIAARGRVILEPNMSFAPEIVESSTLLGCASWSSILSPIT